MKFSYHCSLDCFFLLRFKRLVHLFDSSGIQRFFFHVRLAIILRSPPFLTLNILRCIHNSQTFSKLQNVQIYNSWHRVTCDVETNLLFISFSEIKRNELNFGLTFLPMKRKVFFGIDINTEMTNNEIVQLDFFDSNDFVSNHH